MLNFTNSLAKTLHQFTFLLNPQAHKNNFIDYVKQILAVVEYLMKIDNWEQIYSLKEKKNKIYFIS